MNAVGVMGWSHSLLPPVLSLCSAGVSEPTFSSGSCCSLFVSRGTLVLLHFGCWATCWQTLKLWWRWRASSAGSLRWRRQPRPSWTDLWTPLFLVRACERNIWSNLSHEARNKRHSEGSPTHGWMQAIITGLRSPKFNSLKWSHAGSDLGLGHT